MQELGYYLGAPRHLGRGHSAGRMFLSLASLAIRGEGRPGTPHVRGAREPRGIPKTARGGHLRLVRSERRVWAFVALPFVVLPDLNRAERTSNFGGSGSDELPLARST